MMSSVLRVRVRANDHDEYEIRVQSIDVYYFQTLDILYRASLMQ